MTTFDPFKGIRPNELLLDELLVTQFDHVIERHTEALSEAELQKLAASRGFSQDEVDDSLRYFLKVGSGYRQMLQKQLLIEDSSSHYYLVGINWHGHWVYGVAGELPYQAYADNMVKKHEQTLEENEKELKKITKAIDFNFSPVLLTYQDQEAINDVVQQIALTVPLLQYRSHEGLEHRFWRIEKADTAQTLQKAFSQVSAYYIADGHHRIESAYQLSLEKNGQQGAYGSFIALAIPASQLKMYEFNRVVKDLNGHSVDEFMEKLNQMFLVKPKQELYKPNNKFAFGMYLQGKWYELQMRDATQIGVDPVDRLDVNVLKHFVLTPILGILNVRNSERIAFLDGSKGLKTLVQMVDSGQMEVGFTLCPPPVQELFSVADAGESMPPKATCIEPKLKSGIISRKLSSW